MKIYVVLEYINFEETYVIGVCSTKELAKKLRDTEIEERNEKYDNNWTKDDFEIQEWLLDGNYIGEIEE